MFVRGDEQSGSLPRVENMGPQLIISLLRGFITLRTKIVFSVFVGKHHWGNWSDSERIVSTRRKARTMNYAMSGTRTQSYSSSSIFV